MSYPHLSCPSSSVLDWVAFMKAQGIQRVVGLLSRWGMWEYVVEIRGSTLLLVTSAILSVPHPSFILHTRITRRSEREETYVRLPADVLTQAGLNAVNVDVEEDAGVWGVGGGAVTGKGGIETDAPLTLPATH